MGVAITVWTQVIFKQTIVGVGVVGINVQNKIEKGFLRWFQESASGGYARRHNPTQFVTLLTPLYSAEALSATYLTVSLD